jgi:ribonuclease P protein component
VGEESLRNAAEKDATTLRASNRRALSFPRVFRLVRRREFEAVYRAGRRRSSELFLVFCRANGREFSRFGMSVKKELGRAVTRNRIRRRVREVLRQHRQEFAPGWDIVIHPRRAVATANFQAMTAELVQLLPSARATPGPEK